MKRLLNRSFMLLALIGVLFTSCKKDQYDVPPIQDLPLGQVYTIDQILALESGFVFNEDASVYGTITADEVSGNLYKAAFLQDPETGKAIELYLNATSGVRIGDRVRIYLKGVTYALYNGLPQLSNFEPDGHIIIMANNQPIEPLEASISEICSGSIAPGSLVKLSNVMFTEKNTFADPTTYGNRTLVDPVDYSKTVIVRTSNYANFANDSLPQGTGEMIAIASIYNSTWQLLIRSARELKFDGYHPTGELPYYQDFVSSFGSYTTYDVLGDQKWIIDYETAKMTGYVGNTNYANEDWLISSGFSLENISAACVTMTYVARFFSNINNDITILVSSDYISGNDPNSASWTSVPFAWSESQDWYTFATTTADLSQFVGQKVNLAVRYLSTDVKAGTLEIKSILIQEGSGPTPPPGPTPGPGGEVQAMPYTQDFSSAMGTYGTYSVTGDEEWIIDHSTAKMSGYSGSSHANEDWLYSSPVAITGVNHAKVAVNYVAQYQTSLANDVTLQVSTDYVYGSDPTTATWKQMSASYPNTSNWNDFKTVETSLDEFIGQTVIVAIKYISDDSQSRTFEVKYITVEEGEAGGDTPPDPGQGEGNGTANDPYNVAAGIGLQGNNVVAWVKGYIVGAVKSGDAHNTVTSNDDIDWSAPFGRATNVLIADDASCNEVANCLIVKMPSGSALRSQVNLIEHPDNLGLQLIVNGTLKNAFGRSGLDSPGTASDFVFEGGGTPTPPEPPTPGEAIFSETFANGQGAFAIKDVSMPSGLSYVWSHVSSYACMKANGYYQHSNASESWLVSPAIDLSGVSTATLKFDHAANFAAPQGYFFVMVSADYAGDVATASWTELNVGTWPDHNSNWTFVNATVDLSAFAGQSVTIAFKYSSTEDHCGAWEVKNFVVDE